MDQDISNRLDKIEQMVTDNNRMLARMRSAQKKAAFVRVIWGLCIVALCIWAYNFVKPYIAQIETAYSSINSSVNTIKGL